MANKKISKVANDVKPSTVKETVSKKKQEPVKEVKEVELEDVDDESSPSKKRVAPTKESILSGFDELILSIENQIESLRENQTKANGIKFLRTLNKKLKSLKNQSQRIKQRNSSVKKTNTNNNSGFLKPLKISSDMAKFTVWNATELKSRVDVTKYLCNYIKEHNLQNPEDKRQIIPDAKLAKLIKYDSKKENEPLRYYSLQRFLKPHFLKDTTVEA